jgi:hypothetical protein
MRLAITGAAIITAAVVLVSVFYGRPGGAAGGPPGPGTVLGVYTRGAPETYAGISAFSAATGMRPRVVVYYSGWQERFQQRFAALAASHHALPAVQIDPDGISIAAIAAGRYDGYLRSYAAAVKGFGSQVILSFGHEMNGTWYSWGSRSTSPAVFVAAWRHIVTIFRAAGARNVIWMWTVNVLDRHAGIPSPVRWWPGGSYVNWVGIDGYYTSRSKTFAALFGPTIKVVRSLTLDPILISETAAPAAADQPAKIADLFAGIRAYGLLGFVWFDVNKQLDWRVTGPEAFAAFRRGVHALQGTG